jgi:hypothetical protein
MVCRALVVTALLTSYRLAADAQAPAPSADWRTHTVQSARASFDAPSSYSAYAERPCITALKTVRYLGLLREVIHKELCFYVDSSAEAFAPKFRSLPGAERANCIDCAEYQDVRFDTVQVSPALVIVERGRLSGTIQHWVRHPVVRVVVRLEGGHALVFWAEWYDGPAAEDEFIAIAKTVHALAPAPPNDGW